MNERIKSLIERAEYQAGKHSGSDWEVYVEPSREQIFEKFAELIISECKRVALEEIVRDSDIDAECDPLVKEYLKGNNGGVVDSIVAIQQYFFGVEP